MLNKGKNSIRDVVGVVCGKRRGSRIRCGGGCVVVEVVAEVVAEVDIAVPGVRFKLAIKSIYI